MPSSQPVFAGVELSSGRKPVTFAALDHNLNIISLEKWDITETISCLRDFETVALALSISLRAQEVYAGFKKKITQAGFKAYPKNTHPQQWFEASAQACFRALIGQAPLPRRTLEGRLQRALVLYEQGLQMEDPMEIFEEITRYKLMQGILPLENLPSPKELDALAVAYVAWLMTTQPESRLVIDGHVLKEMILPVSHPQRNMKQSS